MSPSSSSPSPSPPPPHQTHPVENSEIIQRPLSLTPANRVKRLSNAVEKTVERTVDRLSKSVSGVTAFTPGPLPLPSSRRNRPFSLSRSRDKPSFEVTEESRSVSSKTSLTSRSTPPTLRLESRAHDDSPFISPPSPPPRPSLASFRGEGSMRAGTQTLIQALQALPWTDPDNYDEASNHDISSADSDSDEESRQGQLASSIHAIYRPLARSRRLSSPAALRRNGIAVYATVAEEPGQEDSLGSDEDDTEDFEYPTSHVHQSISNPKQDSPVTSLTYSRPPPARSCSGATVKLQRRARLAEKLRQVFDLPGIEEVWSEVPCWLLRSVLLQGYMYLTNSFLCFFAHMPCREDRILKSGSLNKKAQRTKRWIRHWFVLKNDALSWYQSSSDPYFPHGIVDLRYVISCDPLDEKEIRLRTNQKTVLLSADSVPNRDEWVKAIRKVIFKAQNMGDSVKIAIPYSLILDVEKSSAMDFSETIEVKVFEREEHYSVDSYFFAYFRDITSALDQIRDAVRMYRINPTSGSPQAVLDTTASRSAPNSALDRSTNSPTESSNSKGSTVFRLTSLLRPFSESMPFTRQLVSSPISEYKGKDTEDFTHVSKRINSSSFIPVTDSPIQSEEPMDLASSHSMHQGNMGMSSISAEHTYPPSTFRSSLHPDHLSLRRESSSYWNVGVPSWLKNSRRMFSGFTTSTSDTPSQSELRGVREMYSSIASPPTPTSKPSGLDLTYSVLETPELAVDADTAEKFRTGFAYDEKEILLGYFPGYIFRLLPIYGRLYISTNYFCFKSSGPLASRTRMALPIRDILSIEKSKATRFGHHGLVVIIRGHEELFFEFGAEDKRDAFVTLLEHQMEDVRRILSTGEINASSQPKQEALILEEYKKTAAEDAGTALAVPESMTDSLPTVMFTSTSSTFLTFKPSKPLHFTFLTIGSRGDVQPYIALAKGLMADGHRCRIATHGEFQAWIESYGIEFGYVGGDPAELMRICVENGTFTVSFLKEGLLKFRGWLDDLLKTSWEACQGTDVLVESPSAMGGYHIAEALRIPYFRAFTMTWTRTRAYPHAFAVPERKMGGSYNYMSYVMFDQVFWRATSGQINRWRRNVLHLDSTSLDRMEPHKIPFIYNFSPHVVPPPLDWPEWIRVAGYWFLDDADVSATKWTPPLDLVEFIDNAHASGKKVVYIGFGSIVVSDPKGMTQCVVEAVVRSGVYAILSKGWSDRLHSKTIDSVEPEVPLPEQIYSISSIPHDWLFRRIDAACHHGGAGTTGASLRAGIPTIIKPFFGDQYFWADRVEALGVGSGVRKLTVSTLTEALTLATTDQKQVHRAKLLGEQIRSEDGVATAIESIYRDLEYARSLIKRAPANSLSCDDELDAEHSNDGQAINPSSSSGRNPGSCARRVPSEEWSVISEQDDRQSSVSSRHSEGHLARDNSSKRASFTAAVLSVLPDALTPGSPRRRSLSLSSGT